MMCPDDWSGLKKVVVVTGLALLSWAVMALIIYGAVHIFTS
jgi:hypothetical protein